jgi:uncharacterized protein (TIGR00288 family)
MPVESAPNLAVFCDYENVALGVRDARYDSFDIELVLERLLDKGKIVVKKAYCDWERYKSAKRPMHEAGFEMIEIPHLSYSGKNSADIRMVVDALDLCYTKEHVDVFVVISGDSDFSPLVSKLRENNKSVIGLGVKNSSSDMLMENCDEFIYYDDLVRDKKGAGERGKRSSSSRRGRGGDSRKPAEARAEAARPAEGATAAASPAGRADASRPADAAAAASAGPAAAPGTARPAEPRSQAEKSGDKQEAIELVLDTVDALFRERDDNLWGSMVKQTLKRKRPHFSETYYGYRTFNELLEDTQKMGLLELQLDEKSGGYLILGFGPNE